MPVIYRTEKKLQDKMQKVGLLLNFIFLITANLVWAQHITFIQTNDLINLVNNKSDTVFVLNFWATWCKPCVEELPAFEKLHQNYSDKKVKVILISNDFSKQVDSKLKPFIVKNKLKSHVYFMNERTPDKWMPYVNKSWEGNIPATLIVCGSKNENVFFAESLTYETLEKTVLNILNR